MATITLSVQLDSGQIFTTSLTGSDANAARVSAALQATLGLNSNMAVLKLGLRRLVDYAVTAMKAYEKNATEPPDAPFT